LQQSSYTDQPDIEKETDGPCGSCRGSSEPGFNVDTLMKLMMHSVDGIAYTVTQQQSQHQ